MMNGNCFGSAGTREKEQKELAEFERIEKEVGKQEEVRQKLQKANRDQRSRAAQKVLRLKTIMSEEGRRVTAV